MTDPEYAVKVFFLHLESVFVNEIPKNAVFLEMGPGDSIASALLAASVGARKIYLVDAGDFATRDMRFYIRLGEVSRGLGLSLPENMESMVFEEMLEVCQAEYLTEGLSSWRNIPDNIVDFAWSHSTLEHIRKREFRNTMAELYRVMAPGGVVSHNIDLQDHLCGRLNNLRFSERTWESDWMASSGFYTNRLRYSEIMDVFSAVGFTVENQQTGRWEILPTPRHKLSKPFRDMPESDLLIRTMSAELHKSAS